MDALFGFPLAAAMLASSLWTAYLVAARVAEPAAPHVRLAATTLVAFWLHGVVFTVLCHVHLFRLSVAAPLWLICAALAHRKLGGARALGQLSGDLDSARDAIVEIVRSPLRAPLVIAGGAITLSRLLRDAVSPPLAWDAFLYHLYKPARWIQHGGYISEKGPDGWGYLEYFPHGGDIPWAWSMLPVHGDSLTAPAGVLVWSACPLAAYALSRALGAQRIAAGLAALAVGFIPASANLMTSSYGDNFVLAAFLLSGVFVVRLVEAPSVRTAVLAASGLGLVASAKLSGLPVLGLGMLFITWFVIRAERAHGFFATVNAIAIVFAGAGAVSIPGYLRAWIETGSPFYPLTVSFAGRTLIAGNEELHLLYTGRLHDLSAFDDSLLAVLRALTFPVPDPTAEHGGFGHGVLGLVLLAGIGARLLLRDRIRRTALLFLAATAILPFIGIMSDSFFAERTIWQGIIGRLLMIFPAILAVFAARVPGRAAEAGWVVILLFSYASCIPQGWSDPAIEGMTRFALPLLFGLALATLVYAVLRRRLAPFRDRGGWILGPLAGMLVFSLAVAVPLSRIRADLRHRIFEAHNSSRPAYQTHMLDPRYASSWPIWRYLDDGTPHRIALAAGWDGMGHNWYRYPLVGSRLQNQVLYVPFTADGSIIDYREEERVYENADFDAWVKRLADLRIDVVVTLYPWPIEHEWIQEHPDRFEVVATSPDGLNRAYRFHRVEKPRPESHMTAIQLEPVCESRPRR